MIRAQEAGPHMVDEDKGTYHPLAPERQQAPHHKGSNGPASFRDDQRAIRHSSWILIRDQVNHFLPLGFPGALIFAAI